MSAQGKDCGPQVFSSTPPMTPPPAMALFHATTFIDSATSAPSPAASANAVCSKVAAPPKLSPHTATSTWIAAGTFASPVNKKATPAKAARLAKVAARKYRSTRRLVMPIPASAARPNTSSTKQCAQPIFDAIGRKTWYLGEDPVCANIAKIAGNMMITMAIESMAEASALTEAYGLRAADFLEVVTQTLFACPSYQRYGKNIAERRYEPGFRLALGFKDAVLAGDAATDRDVNLPGATVVRDRLREAARTGWADKDWSALAEVEHPETPASSRHRA